MNNMKWFLSSAAILLLGLSVYAQIQTGKAGGGPAFFIDAANFASADTTKGRLEVFVKIAHSELVFVKQGNNAFRAKYEIIYAVYDKKNQLIERSIDDRDIVVDNYNETVMDTRFHFNRKTFNLSPGSYEISVMITDKETGAYGQRKQDAPVRLFRDKAVAVSDLIFADKIQKDTANSIVNIAPNVFRSFDSDYETYLVYFEIYNNRFAARFRDTLSPVPSDSEEVLIKYRVLDKNQVAVFQDSLTKTVSAYQTFSSFAIDKSSLTYGRYILDVSVVRGQERASVKTLFDVRSANFTHWGTSGSFDLDLAIKQMRHIARNVNLGKILKGTKEEKEQFFNDFWKKKDPTPDTQRNEMMEEYYRRVNYANRYFTSGYREGWETDCGMVYITMDAPDGIERYPFETDSKPFEIWYYYEANLKLIFFDNYGFGDYELHPASRMQFESYVFSRRR